MNEAAGVSGHFFSLSPVTPPPSTAQRLRSGRPPLKTPATILRGGRFESSSSSSSSSS
ncbi:hypothetical protein ACHAW5_003336 [Stephanodiscus triporus]|uniref:Uncharacterized protein n=1 Tax=Stephanodiscus triporus TaxID=2934178 RepID=A0ABD3PG28_9STRA